LVVLRRWAVWIWWAVGAAVVLLMGDATAINHRSSLVGRIHLAATEVILPGPPPAAPPHGGPQLFEEPVVTGESALLTPPSSPRSKPYNESSECSVLLDPGWSEADPCQVAQSTIGTAAAVAEYRNPDGRPEVRALVYIRDRNEWNLALEAGGRDHKSFRPMMHVVDLAKDGNDKIVWSLRFGGGMRMPRLVVEVVEVSGKVLIHRDLPRGIAREATGGGLETWSAHPPDWGDWVWTHQIIRYKDGAWRIVLSEEVPASEVPRPPASGEGFL
jgi:hypothetical protein